MIDTKELRAVVQEIGLNGLCPAEVYELLDRLETAEKERDVLRTAVRHEADCVEAAMAEIKSLRAEIEAAEIYAAERDNAKQRYSSAVRLLTGIHALLYPPRFTDHDGRTWQFKSPLAEEQMQELSDRIRALPDEIARSAMEKSK